eukprot:CAMPEP_0179273576 /NCGR_PEP_ID=MMETSP0797-20121207/33083_1 /TAXON_ID=47934 /ORGANISM="Dinophysis acuminata, Strain DAEP01" /LENGTH=126 /DNA_ID=CAMNT_0020982005 /DNA_START=25 /DNA_END=406 /DNA_ORIENTATION=-
MQFAVQADNTGRSRNDHLGTKARMAYDILGESRLRQVLVQADHDATRCAELLRKRQAAADGSGRTVEQELTPEEEAELKRLRKQIWELAEVFGPTCDLWHGASSMAGVDGFGSRRLDINAEGDDVN